MEGTFWYFGSVENITFVSSISPHLLIFPFSNFNISSLSHFLPLRYTHLLFCKSLLLHIFSSSHLISLFYSCFSPNILIFSTSLIFPLSNIYFSVSFSLKSWHFLTFSFLHFHFLSSFPALLLSCLLTRSFFISFRTRGVVPTKRY